MNTQNHKQFMNRAIELSRESVSSGGGPFGAVIVKDGKIVGEGMNGVTVHNDPTAHGEIVAIRNACQNLKSFQLDGCTIYTSTEPCPMCLGAIYWARPEAVYYGNSKEDLARIEKDNVENEYLVQEFIPYEKDLRVFVINNKIWGVMERVPADGHFKANISQGGFGTKLEDQKIYSKIEAIIDKISPKFNVEIAGYDFLIKGDEIYFLEINSNPGYKGLNVALNVETQAAIADYMDSLLN